MKDSNEPTTQLFGELLVSKDLVTQQQLTDALQEQQQNGGRLGEVLVRMEVVSQEDITKALAEHLDLEYHSLDDVHKIDLKIARLLTEPIAKRFCLVAIGEDEGKIVVAMADPLNVIAIDTITLKIKRQLHVVISSEKEIVRAIEAVYHGVDLEEQRMRDLVELEVSADTDGIEADEMLEDIAEADISSEAEAAKAPVIRFVDLLLSQSVKSCASDIHVEPQEKTMSIRMRIDGVLRDMVPPARRMQAAVITRLKILAKMDIAERRLPQDGRFKIKAPGRDIDVRVNAIPTIYGEKIVMRILDKAAVNHDINKIGLEPELLEELKVILDQPHGIVIVTGPTGSGKSTTLYSCLNYLKDPTLNITTVEDPVEYRLAGINQVQIKSEIGLSFASCLRAILRQDPDVCLLGEIRDKETMEIAVQASLTGHLVLSTFHTNDAPSAITRFAHMGLERYLLASSLNLVVAQRLIRRVCQKCKEPVTLSEVIMKRLNLTPEKLEGKTIYKGKGCPSCNGSGYKGRAPIFEFMVMSPEIREMIVEGASESDIRKKMTEKGYGGLLDSGVQRMLDGITTAEEVIGVTYAETLRD